jgi:hypothetical protein
MRNFNFEAPTRILFGKNKLNELPIEIGKFGSRVLLAYGGGSIKKTGLYDEVVRLLRNAGLFFVELPGIQPNPRMKSVREGVELCRQHQLDFILAVGGGSVIDCTKAIAAGVNYNGDAWDFMIRKAKVVNPLPIGTILTLAATGSEMNGGAVISNEETGDKRSMFDEALKPRFSVLDPSLTFTVDKWQSAAGVVDVMSHIFEQYFTPDQGTEVQDAIAEAILKTCVKYGPVVLDDPENYEARANIMWASSLALNGLTSTGKIGGDWATHLMEHEMSVVNDVTHGAGLAILFPEWMNFVMDENSATKFARMARNVWGVEEVDDVVAARVGIRLVREFFNSLGMPSKLSEVGIDDGDIDRMAKNACLFGKIGMLRKLDVEDVKSIFKLAQ